MKRTPGFWFLTIIGILLVIIYLIGQTMAVINYDFTVSIDLQESVEDITEVGVALNKGFGFGDTVIYIPLLIIGIIGLFKRKNWGIYAMSGAMAITIYWPIVSLSTVIFAQGSPGFNFTDYTSYAILLPSISLYGLWGFWYLYKNRSSLSLTK